MPQMSPMNWILLFVLLTMIFFMIIIMNYFILIPMKLIIKKKKINSMTWKW